MNKSIKEILQTVADRFDSYVEYADYVDIELTDETVIRVSSDEDEEPGTFYGGIYLDRSEDDRHIEGTGFTTLTFDGLIDYVAAAKIIFTR